MNSSKKTIKNNLKVILILLCFVGITNSEAIGQIEAIDLRTAGGKEIGRLSYLGEMNFSITEINPSPEDTISSETYYRISYKDYRYSRIYSVESFYIDNYQSLLDFKKLVIDAFNTKERGYARSFKMGNDFITVARFRSFGITSVKILVSNKGYSTDIMRKQWEKIFRNVN